MARLTRKECAGVAGVALVAAAITWFAVTASRNVPAPDMPECVTLYTPVETAPDITAAGDSTDMENGRRDKGMKKKRDGKSDTGKKTGAGNKKGKNVNKDKGNRVDRSFLDEKL